MILVAHGARYGVGGRADLYYDMTRQAVALLDNDSPLEERIYTWTGVGYSAWCRGRTSEALAAFEQVESLAEDNPNAGFELSGFSAWTWASHMQAMALAFLDRPDEADEAASAAIGRCHSWSLASTVWTRPQSGHEAQEREPPYANILGGYANDVGSDARDLRPRSPLLLQKGAAEAAGKRRNAVGGLLGAVARVGTRRALLICVTRNFLASPRDTPGSR